MESKSHVLGLQRTNSGIQDFAGKKQSEKTAPNRVSRVEKSNLHSNMFRSRTSDVSLKKQRVHDVACSIITKFSLH